MDRLALLQGVTTPIQDMVRAIQQHGWELGKVQYDSKLGQFVAEATSPIGDRPISKFGPDQTTAIANLMNAVVRRVHMRTTAMWKVGMWPVSFHDKLHDIADAYRQAPIYDPRAAAAWKALGDDSVHRLHVLGEQLHIEPTLEPIPYATADEMRKDVHEKRHYLLSQAPSNHPVWTPDQVAAFRAVHDILGFGVAGGQYDWPGRNLAAAAHFPLLEPVAQQALFTEAIARPAFLHVHGQGPQKVAVLPDYIDGPIQDHNPPGHRGLHPSQVTAPVGLHGITAAASLDANYGWDSGIDPMDYNAYLHHGDPMQAKATMDNAAKIDTGWSNFKTGDGQEDRERMKLAIVNAFRVVLLSPRKDLRWNAIHYQHIADIPGRVDDPKVYWDRLEQNRRRWNEAQGIHPMAHMVYFEFLKPFEAMIHAQHPEKGWGYAKEKSERTLFNWWTQEQERIQQEDAQKPSDKQRPADEIERRANEALARRLKVFLKPTDDKIDFEDSQIKLFGSAQDVMKHLGDVYPVSNPEHILDWTPGQPGKGILFRDGVVHTWNTEPESYGDGHPYHGEWIATHAADRIGDRNRKLEQTFSIAPDGNTSAGNWALSHLQAADPRLKSEVHGMDYYDLFKEGAAGQYNLLTGEEGLKYGAFMGTHLKAISQVSRHADEILDAALQDVREHDATGHHFRHAVLSLGVPGVGPKVCSFAWLLLQPLTSQLATIDTHMMDVLGHHYEKDMNNRDYFKFERELAAGRDAAGYSHVPLGAFQWGMWDYKRTGPGSHQDHSAMRVLDPVPHNDVDWVGKAVNLKGESWHSRAPDWWQNTQDARDEVANEWDNTYGKEFPQNAIPYQDVGLQMAAAMMDWDDTFTGPPIERDARPGMRYWKGITDISGKEHRWDGYAGTHLDYLKAQNIHPDQVQSYWYEDYDGNRENLDSYQDYYRKYYNEPTDPRGTRTAGYDEGFEYWWRQETPIGSSLDSKARKLAEYAKADKKSKDWLEEYLDDHKDETRLSDPSFKRFKTKLFKKFERISKIAARSSYIPIFNHPETGQEHVGMPGQTLMEHARLMTGMDTQDVWRLLADEHVRKEPNAMQPEPSAAQPR